jgi:hypothetical protein
VDQELLLVGQRIERLEEAVGDVRERLLNCVKVADHPQDALGLSRGVAEALAKRVLAGIGLKPAATLDACLKELEEPRVMSRGLVPAEVITLLHMVRVLGNKATHDALRIEVTASDAALVLRSVLRVVEWYFVEFERGPRLNPLFRPGAAPPLLPADLPPPAVRLPPLLFTGPGGQRGLRKVFAFTDRLIGLGREKPSRDPRVHIVTRLLPCPGPAHPNWSANLENIGQFHAQLWWQLGRVEVRDENSSHGVLLDGRPIARGVWTLCSLPRPARVRLGPGGVEFTVAEVVRPAHGTQVPCVRLERLGNGSHHEYLLVSRPLLTVGSDPDCLVWFPGVAPRVASVVVSERGWSARQPDGAEVLIEPSQPFAPSGSAVRVSLAAEDDFLS